MRIFIVLLGLFFPNVHAQVRPAWLDRKAITVDVLSDAGLVMGPRVEIKRGARVLIHVYQGKAPEFLDLANSHAARAPAQDAENQAGTDDDRRHWVIANYARARANYEAYPFEWTAGTDVSLAHLKRILHAPPIPVPQSGLLFSETYRTPRALLLAVNGRVLQPTPPRTCTSLLENPPFPLRRNGQGIDFMPDFMVKLEP